MVYVRTQIARIDTSSVLHIQYECDLDIRAKQKRAQ